MTAAPTPWRRKGPLAIVLAVSLALCSSACATHDALGLARKACAQVDKALAVYDRSQAEGPTTPKGVADSERSLAELHAALPIASTAAGESPQWQALSTTLEETKYAIPESDLVKALNAQCAATVSNGLPGS